jgi:hypothetical protein
MPLGHAALILILSSCCTKLSRRSIHFNVPPPACAILHTASAPSAPRPLPDMSSFARLLFRSKLPHKNRMPDPMQLPDTSRQVVLVCVYTCVRESQCVCACMHKHNELAQQEVCIGIGSYAYAVTTRAVVVPFLLPTSCSLQRACRSSPHPESQDRTPANRWC